MDMPHEPEVREQTALMPPPRANTMLNVLAEYPRALIAANDDIPGARPLVSAATEPTPSRGWDPYEIWQCRIRLSPAEMGLGPTR
jgi:hypothetical protein